MKEGQSFDEFMQELLPGSKTFPVKLLCPCCGWHFKHGFTDVHDQTGGKLVPNIAIVCGQCLRVLKTNEKLELVALSKEELAALEPQEREGIAASWQLAYFALMLNGPEPKGPTQ